MKKVNLNEEIVDFDACVMLMDDELREEIHRDLAPCTDQEFLNEYVKRHQEKYNKDFQI
jgi:hypothetical protein